MDSFKVIGPCQIADAMPGETITREKLEAEGANIDALVLGKHIEPVGGSKSTKGKATSGSD